MGSKRLAQSFYKKKFGIRSSAMYKYLHMTDADDRLVSEFVPPAKVVPYPIVRCSSYVCPTLPRLSYDIRRFSKVTFPREGVRLPDFFVLDESAHIVRLPQLLIRGARLAGQIHPFAGRTHLTLRQTHIGIHFWTVTDGNRAHAPANIKYSEERRRLLWEADTCSRTRARTTGCFLGFVVALMDALDVCEFPSELNSPKGDVSCWTSMRTLSSVGTSGATVMVLSMVEK